MFRKYCNMHRAVWLFFLFTFIWVSISAQNIDIDVLKAVNRHGSSFKDKYLELNASSVSYVTIGTPAVLLTAGLLGKDKKLKEDALFMAGAYLLSGGITSLTKKTIKRPRPYEAYDFVIKRDDEAGGYSFPSGHTSSAFNVATGLALRYPKWQVIVPCSVYACSVAWARMYQGVHYPSDVLAGALIGASSAWLSYHFQQRLYNKNKPHENQTACVGF